MSYDAYNVWDSLYGMMCIPCYQRQWCHGDGDDANDAQMCTCIENGQIKRVNKQIKRENISDPLGDIEDVDLTPIDEPRLR